MLLRYLACSSADSPVRAHLSHLHCLPGHHGKILELADQAGMIEWSPISVEESDYTRVSDKLIMTSFAVQKDENPDRIIS